MVGLRSERRVVVNGTRKHVAAPGASSVQPSGQFGYRKSALKCT
jgi:hypothetical protein